MHTHTRQEINREIKRRLREAINQESLNNLIEIVDLEANFIRVPLHMVLDKVMKQIYGYIKNSAIKLTNTHICLESKTSIDDLESPFDICDRFIKVIEMQNSGIEIFRFVNQKSPSIKSLA